MKVFTIGFTRKSAKQFFDLLEISNVKRVVDVRLNNVSQLAGFSKRDDLAYFLKRIGNISYTHEPLLAPTQPMLDEYKKNGGDWATYEARFLDLMEKRRVEKEVPRELIENGCLLCSEEKPHHCHRRVVAEYFRSHWGDVEISHLT